MVQKVFNRVEKKYLLNEEQFQAVMGELKAYMEMDEYGLHTIRNIYFDTVNNELIRTSIEKPCYKEKFRVRCYGKPEEDSQIFLEIKKKYKGIVNKRRITMTRTAARAYLLENEKPKQMGQIEREIDYFLAHYDLKPALYLAYDRIALFGKKDQEFRVTFDQNIRSRREHLVLDDDTNTVPLLEEGYHLMEVKITDAMPLWFVDILSRYEIRNVSFSKYGTIYLNNLVAGAYEYGTKNTIIHTTDTENYANCVLQGVMVSA